VFGTSRTRIGDVIILKKYKILMGARSKGIKFAGQNPAFGSYLADLKTKLAERAPGTIQKKFQPQIRPTVPKPFQA
jgi:hypothetical protein